MSAILNKTEWVEREYNKFMSEYEVEPIEEFKVSAMFKLMYEYNHEVKNEHVKTRRELLEMIHRLQSTLKVKKKELIVPSEGLSLGSKSDKLTELKSLTTNTNILNLILINNLLNNSNLINELKSYLNEVIANKEKKLNDQLDACIKLSSNIYSIEDERNLLWDLKSKVDKGMKWILVDNLGEIFKIVMDSNSDKYNISAIERKILDIIQKYSLS